MVKAEIAESTVSRLKRAGRQVLGKPQEKITEARARKAQVDVLDEQNTPGDEHYKDIGGRSSNLCAVHFDTTDGPRRAAEMTKAVTRHQLHMTGSAGTVQNFMMSIEKKLEQLEESRRTSWRVDHS